MIVESNYAIAIARQLLDLVPVFQPMRIKTKTIDFSRVLSKLQLGNC